MKEVKRRQEPAQDQIRQGVLAEMIWEEGLGQERASKTLSATKDGPLRTPGAIHAGKFPSQVDSLSKLSSTAQEFQNNTPKQHIATDS